MTQTSVPAPKVPLAIGKVVCTKPVAGIVPESALVHSPIRIHLNTISFRVVEDPFPAVRGAVAKLDPAETVPCAPLEFSTVLIPLLALCAPVGRHALPVWLPFSIDAAKENTGLVRKDLDRQVPVQEWERLLHEALQLCAQHPSTSAKPAPRKTQSGSRKQVELAPALGSPSSAEPGQVGGGQTHILAARTAAQEAVGEVPRHAAALHIAQAARALCRQRARPNANPANALVC